MALADESNEQKEPQSTEQEPGRVLDLDNERGPKQPSLIVYRDVVDLQFRQITVVGSPLGHSGLAAALHETADAYEAKHDVTHSTSHLQTTLLYREAAVNSTVPTDTSRAVARFLALFRFISQHFQRFSDTRHLDALITHGRAVLANVPAGDHNIPALLDILSYAYSIRYEKLNALHDLKAALKFEASSTCATPLGHPSMWSHLSNLAISHKRFFQRTGSLDNLNASMMYNVAGIDSTHLGSGEARTRLQIALSDLYIDRHRKFRVLDDLKSALELDPVYVTPLGHPSMSHKLINMADFHRRLFVQTQTDSPRYLNASIMYNEAALDSLPGPDEDRVMRWRMVLSASYRTRYERWGNDADLLAALTLNKAIVKDTPPGHPYFAGHLSNLGITYQLHNDRYGAMAELHSAIKYNKAALENTPVYHPERASRQLSLATSYGHRYLRYGNLADLEAAIQLQTMAIQNMRPGVLADTMFQHNLGFSYFQRYLKLGDLDDLDIALQHQKAVLADTPVRDPQRPMRQASLAASYTERYQRLGAMDDLTTALRLALAALGDTPLDHLARFTRHYEVGLLYQLRFKRLSDPTDIEASIKYIKASVEAIPPDHLSFRIYQQSLAESYIARYRLSDNLEDLDAGLVHHTAALELTPENHPHYPSSTASLARLHLLRYKKFGEQGNIDAAIKFATAAVDKSPPGHEWRRGHLTGLATVYAVCYDASNDILAKEKSMILAQMALNTYSTNPHLVWNSAVGLAHVTARHEHPISIRAYKQAIAVLPDLLWIGTSLTTRHHVLVQNGIQTKLADAVSLSIHFGEYRLAVEFMEQGLSITHQQSLGLKSGDLNLSQNHPQEAAELQKLSAEVLKLTEDAAGPDRNEYPPDYISSTVKRDRLIAAIRKYPEHKNFLKPSSYEKLSYAAAKGPVILLNYSPPATDAIIILRPAASPISVPLDGVNSETIRKYFDILNSVLAGFRIHTSRDTTRHGKPARKAVAESKFQEVTCWLWTFVVEPVFKALHDNGIINGRIWWCTSGPFTYLPVHAAAPVDSPYIQSYTTSLASLLRARAGTSPSVLTPDLCTTVGVAHLPDRPWMSLPLVPEELDSVAFALQNHCTVNRLDADITVENVLIAMKTSSWLHLACHGKQDPEDPLKSHLVLPDGDLELRTILKADLPSAKFAFLSACETAMGNTVLANEAIHFAGGFIAAGFQGAIGTLWSMFDSDGPRVAEAVYKNVCGERGGLDVTLAAEGLHAAVRKLREAGVPPHRWAPFVHFGI